MRRHRSSNIVTVQHPSGHSMNNLYDVPIDNPFKRLIDNNVIILGFLDDPPVIDVFE
jgi:hypothetical protein